MRRYGASRIALATALLGVLGVLLAGCAGAPPEILFTEAELFVVRDPVTGAVAESLRVFVAVRDPDGPDDVTIAWLIHDEHELYWEMQAGEWSVLEHGGDTWYGMPDLRMPGDAPFPRGAYRVIVEDRSLARDESTLYLTAPATYAAAHPRLVVSGEAISVDHFAPVIFRVYTRAGQLVVNRKVSPGPVPESATGDPARKRPAGVGCHRGRRAPAVRKRSLRAAPLERLLDQLPAGDQPLPPPTLLPGRQRVAELLPQ